MCWDDIVGSVEADDERQITVADDWQLQRLAHSSSTDTVAPCPGDKWLCALLCCVFEDSDTERWREWGVAWGQTGQDANTHGILIIVNAAGSGWSHPPPRPFPGHFLDSNFALVAHFCSSFIDRVCQLLTKLTAQHNALQHSTFSLNIYCAMKTKLRLYQTYIVPVLMYGCETWATTKYLLSPWCIWHMGTTMCQMRKSEEPLVVHRFLTWWLIDVCSCLAILLAVHLARTTTEPLQ